MIEDGTAAEITEHFRRDEVSAPELLSRVTSQVEVRDLAMEEPDIESIVREIYAR